MADKIVIPPLPKKIAEARTRSDRRAAALFNAGLTKEPYGQRTPAQAIKETHGERVGDVQLQARNRAKARKK